MDESIFCHGRPHGGCSILYSNQYDVTPIYFKEERRIVGIKISLCNSIFQVRHNALMTEEEEASITEQDHCYNLPPKKTEIRRYLNPACQYAADIVNVTTYEAEREKQLFQPPIQLKEHNIGVNKSTTEDYTISMKETENGQV